MGVRIVVAEDDEKQAELVRRYLVREGHEVTVVHDGEAAIEQVRATAAELVVLDVMLPGADGFEVCRALRAASEVLVLMLTARVTEDDLLHGLDLGADDYMTKPFSPRELVARVRTLLRRASRAPASRPLRVGALVVDLEAHEVDGERPVHCTRASSGCWRRWRARPGTSSPARGCSSCCTGPTATSRRAPWTCTS